MLLHMPRRDQPQPTDARLSVPISFRLSNAQRDALGFLADREGVAIGAIARRALDAYFTTWRATSGAFEGRSLLEVAESGELTEFGDFVEVDQEP